MRIVYVLTSLGMGGAERQVIALAEAMARGGHQVALLVLRPRLKEEWPTDCWVVSLEMGKAPLRVMRALLRGRQFLADFGPGIVHSHGFHANIFARLLRLLVPAPVVVSTIHNVYEGGWHRMLAYRLTDPLSLRTTAVSQAAAHRFVRLKAVPQKKCFVVPNAFEPAEFLPQPERRAMARSAMGVPESAQNSAPDSTFVWLAAGRITAAKGYPNLLRAFALLRLSRADAKLWVAGEFSSPSIAPLCALAAELEIGDSLRWLGLRRDMPALLDAADGFVQASEWEGMPLAIGEAMCMEKPVVATGVGGVRELVGDAGIVVDPRDPRALADAMIALMRMPEQARRALGRSARLRIEQRFNMEERIGEWNALYAEMVAEAAEARR